MKTNGLMIITTQHYTLPITLIIQAYTFLTQFVIKGFTQLGLELFILALKVHLTISTWWFEPLWYPTSSQNINSIQNENNWFFVRESQLKIDHQKLWINDYGRPTLYFTHKPKMNGRNSPNHPSPCNPNMILN
jgi:hypothetical protein